VFRFTGQQAVRCPFYQGVVESAPSGDCDPVSVLKSNGTEIAEVDCGEAYEVDDSIIYDIPNRHRWQELHSGTGSVILTEAGKVIGYYLNGQRIKDFIISGTTLTPDQPLVSGDIVAVDYYENGYGVIGEVHNSGFLYTSGAFAQGTSRVYLNGIRQLLGTDYLEISDNSLLMSNPIEEPTNIVTNIDNFLAWNI